jgi:hypothetical protein
MIRTKNFRPDADTKLLCTCGHPDCDQRSINQESLDKVQLVRDDADRPLTVRSGGRCPNHPDEVHRTKPADHQKCIVLDLAVNGGAERGELVELGIKHGANRIGVAKTFVHLGWAPGEQLVMWVY